MVIIGAAAEVKGVVPGTGILDKGCLAHWADIRIPPFGEPVEFRFVRCQAVGLFS